MFVAAEELGAETVSLDSIKIGEVVRRVQWALPFWTFRSADVKKVR